MNPYYSDRHGLTLYCGGALSVLRELPSSSIQTCVTSPPYWGLRDYGVEGQLGLETTPEAYISSMVAVFSEVRRVMRGDGTLRINLGDSYCSTITCNAEQTIYSKEGWKQPGRGPNVRAGKDCDPKRGPAAKGQTKKCLAGEGLKPKDLVGIPWRVAFALQADGWYLRSDIIWAKPNPMPESVGDRPTKSHEYLFLMSKNQKYYYDSEAIKEPMSVSSVSRLSQNIDAQEGSYRVPGKTNGTMKAVGHLDKQRGHSRRHAGFNDRWDAMERAEQCSGMRNKRDVWTVATAPFSEAHFATFPEALIEPCILAGSPEGGTVLDPFNGAGTTGLVTSRKKRSYVGIELKPEYCDMSIRRWQKEQPTLSNLR